MRGHDYLDLCLGDTGGLCGHAHPKIVGAIANSSRTGGPPPCTPRRIAYGVARSSRAEFKLPYWQLLMSATDANRMALRRHANIRAGTSSWR